jgi:hypothetical protein
MGAKTKRSGAAKPPEDRSEAGNADSSRDWRTRATKGDDSSDSEEEDLPAETRRRKLKVAEVYKDQEDEEVVKRPEAPYRGVPEVVISVPRKEPTKAFVGTQPSKPEERLYRLRAPVQEEGLAKKLAKRILDGEVTFKAREATGISNEVREEVRRQLSKIRQPIIPRKEQDLVQVGDSPDDPLPFLMEEVSMLGDDALEIKELPQVQHVFVTSVAKPEFPAGSVMIPDPYLQYLESLAPDEAPKPVYVDETKRVFVATESARLRVINPKIHGMGQVESVIDSGSQIVSMAYDLAKEIGLTWDPDVQIYMQSANGSLEKSVGLARNVSFKFGDIVVYLQVHIINNPAYKVLLGRPFEILTESTFENGNDGSQIVTIKDPNTGRRTTMATLPRGEEKESIKQASIPVNPSAKTADPSKTTKDFHRSSRN